MASLLAPLVRSGGVSGVISCAALWGDGMATAGPLLRCSHTTLLALLGARAHVERLPPPDPVELAVGRVLLGEDAHALALELGLDPDARHELMNRLRRPQPPRRKRYRGKPPAGWK